MDRSENPGLFGQRNRPSPLSSGNPQEALSRARWLWRCCLILPFLYIGFAAAVHHLLFAQKMPFGFWPMGDKAYRGILFAFCIIAVLAEAAILGLRYFFQKKLNEVRLIPIRASELYWQRTLWMLLCADLVSGLGLIAFLLRADWMALIVFCIVSYLLYIQAYPRGRFLE